MVMSPVLPWILLLLVTCLCYITHSSGLHLNVGVSASFTLISWQQYCFSNCETHVPLSPVCYMSFCIVD